jgi:hypothetical protein
MPAELQSFTIPSRVYFVPTGSGKEPIIWATLVNYSFSGSVTFAPEVMPFTYSELTYSGAEMDALHAYSN